MTAEGWALSPPPPVLPPAIFLDVDGVLHPAHQGRARRHFVANNMMHLRTIVEATGAVIVLSSFWQNSAATRAEVNEALRRWGIAPFVAVTANANPGAGEERRAFEIVTWVRAHPHACATGWVALDDLDLLSVAPPPTFKPIMPANHFVRTNQAMGLTAKDAAKAIELLGGKAWLGGKDPPKLPPVLPSAHQPFAMTATTVGYQSMQQTSYSHPSAAQSKFAHPSQHRDQVKAAPYNSVAGAGAYATPPRAPALATPPPTAPPPEGLFGGAPPGSPNAGPPRPPSSTTPGGGVAAMHEAAARGVSPHAYRPPSANELPPHQVWRTDARYSWPPGYPPSIN